MERSPILVPFSSVLCSLSSPSSSWPLVPLFLLVDVRSSRVQLSPVLDLAFVCLTSARPRPGPCHCTCLRPRPCPHPRPCPLLSLSLSLFFASFPSVSVRLPRAVCPLRAVPCPLSARQLPAARRPLCGCRAPSSVRLPRAVRSVADRLPASGSPARPCHYIRSAPMSAAFARPAFGPLSCSARRSAS